MTVVDTSFLIALERGEERARERYAELLAAGAHVRVPAATWLEFLTPFAPAQRAEAARRLERASQFEAFTREISEEAARLQHELLREGGVLAWHDLQIAATALHFREPLLSNDRSFDRVPGLERLSH